MRSPHNTVLIGCVPACRLEDRGGTSRASWPIWAHWAHRGWNWNRTLQTELQTEWIEMDSMRKMLCFWNKSMKFIVADGNQTQDLLALRQQCWPPSLKFRCLFIPLGVNGQWLVSRAVLPEPTLHHPPRKAPQHLLAAGCNGRSLTAQLLDWPSTPLDFLPISDSYMLVLFICHIKEIEVKTFCM